MEAKLGGKAHHFYGPVVSDLKAVGKRNVEWDLNDWKWDGDLFTAAPLNTLPSDCRSRQLFPVGSEVQADTGLSNSSSSFSDEVNLQNEKGKRELEKRRRVVVIEDEELYEEAGSLNLKLGGQLYNVTEEEAERWEGKNGKKSKIAGTTSNRAVCQVDDCRADLSNAKDYHRRHKVCDMHSKATKALVGNVMQRFCQQCSRFHALQEFDEGKRSCRRRLAGHNRRRRKTHPENTVNGSSLTDERGSSYLLISLLRILSNIHSNSSDQIKDQDLLSHLLRNLSSLAGTVNERNLSGLLSGSQDLQNAETSFAALEKEPACSRQKMSAPQDELIQKRTFADFNQSGTQQIPSPSQVTIPFPAKDRMPTNGGNAMGSAVGKTKLSNFDLNSAYDDSQDCMETVECFDAPTNLGTGPGGCPLWLRQDSHKSSPPQTSGNSGSTATQSPSSSSGEAQSRTDRIVIKLFGKDPSEFPLVLRNQILDWLSHSPTDIESYIRPGCVILTVYLRMENSSWEDLCLDLSSRLRKLLDASGDSFWRTGWVYARVLHHVAFVCDGQIVLNTPLPLGTNTTCRILSIKPIAVPVSERAQFSVKGFNLSRSTSRLLCALEGEYLVQRRCSDVLDGQGSSVKHEEAQSLGFSCSIPDVSGRGFIEIEDDSLCSSFFPFIVAEPDVCSEICTLESALEVAGIAGDVNEAEKLEPRNLALDFINEIGWLLHRRQLKSRLANMDPTSALFSFKRFRWLMEFSIDHDWCAVVNKLLDTLFSGTVDLGEYHSVELALGEIGLLHRAVRRNCRPMVQFLLNYYPETYSGQSGSEEKGNLKGQLILFRPDEVGPGKLTPLHIAASRDGSESVLDALTDDPQQVGIEAWRSVRDSAGLTPNDYASLRGHYTYIHLVQRKIHKKSGSGHVVVDIPAVNPNSKSVKVASFQTEKTVIKPIPCNLCERKLALGGGRISLAIYRPAMLSMVAIAAVCVCVALLFKSSPEVLYVFQPFRWDRLKYGSS